MVWLYVMWAWRYPLRCKIGISKEVRRRLARVSSSIESKTYVIIALPIVSAKSFERLLHGLFWFAHAPIPNTDGGSEWFRFVLPVAVLAVLAIFLTQILFVIGIIFSLCDLFFIQY